MCAKLLSHDPDGVVAVQDGLRPTRRARRVEREFGARQGKLQGAAPPPFPRPTKPRMTCNDPRPPAGPPPPAWALAPPRSARLHHADMVITSEHRRHENHTTAHFASHEADFRLAKDWNDRIDDQTCERGGKIDHHRFMPVRQLERDPAPRRSPRRSIASASLLAWANRAAAVKLSPRSTATTRLGERFTSAAA